MKKLALSAICFAMTLILSNAVLAQAVTAVDDELEKYWLVEKKVAPRYPRMALKRGIMGCAAVGYVIQADGSTSEHEILAYYPSDVFDKSAIKAARQFIYKPSEQNTDKISVITLNVFTYTVSTEDEDDDQKQEVLSEACTKAGRNALMAGDKKSIDS